MNVHVVTQKCWSHKFSVQVPDRFVLLIEDEAAEERNITLSSTGGIIIWSSGRFNITLTSIVHKLWHNYEAHFGQ
jgi:hypothetical protein